MEKIISKKKVNEKVIDLPFKNYFLAAGVFSLLVTTLSLIVQSRLPPQIPLFYSLPQGEEQLSDSIGLVVPNLFSLSIITVNFFLARKLQDDFLKKILAIASLVVSILAAITTLKIAFLIGQF